MERTGAVILAAGGSARLGRPKQFLEHDGQTLIGRAVAAAADCAPIVVVTGRDHERLAGALQGVTLLHHREWERGIGSSIRAGVARALELSPDLDSILILVCDQPFVAAAVVNALRSARARDPKPAAACSYAGSLGVPALFARSLFPDLLSLADDSGAKRILSKLAGNITIVDFPEGAIDIDTEADRAAHLQ